MASVRIERARVGWHIWLQWVLASILGFAVGAAVGNAVIDSIPPMTCAQSSSDTLVDKLTNFPCMLPMLYGAFLGVAGGFMQWLVLRRQIAGAGWLGVSQHTWLRDSCGRGHDVSSIKSSRQPGLQPRRESHRRPNPDRGCIWSCGRDPAVDRLASEDYAGRLVGACALARLAGGWRPRYHYIPCSELDWILSIHLGCSWSYVRSRIGCNHWHHAGLVVAPARFRKIGSDVDGS